MSQPGINLLPSELLAVEERSKTIKKITIFCVAELLVVALVVIGVFIYRRSVMDNWQELLNEVAAQTEYINRDENRILEGKLRLVKEKIQVLRDHFESDASYSEYLSGLFERIPTGVELVSLRQITEDQYSFSGRADSLDQVEDFSQILLEWEDILSVSLQSFDYQIEKGMLTFNIFMQRKS